MIYYSPEKKNYIIRDLQSTNGTFVNRKRITGECTIMDKDELILGDVTLVFHQEKESDLDTDTGTHRLKRISRKSKVVDSENLGDYAFTQTLSELEEQKLTSIFNIQVDLNIHPGEKIGGYEIIRKVGEGDYSAIYLASKSGSKETDALKIYKNNFAAKNNGQKIWEIFDKCFKSSSQVSHPALVRYYDCGAHHGRFYYTMKYLSNGNLQGRIFRSAPFTELECLDLVLNSSVGLNAAYSDKKVFHGYLTPANILYNESDSIEISDYGFSEWITKCREEGLNLISPWYASPEISTGVPIDWYSDLYSLGIILFQMITGVLPYYSQNEEDIFNMHATLDLPKPQTRNPNIKITEGTAALIAGMTAKKPEKRFSSWAEFLRKVQSVYDEVQKESEENSNDD